MVQILLVSKGSMYNLPAFMKKAGKFTLSTKRPCEVVLVKVTVCSR